MDKGEALKNLFQGADKQSNLNAYGQRILAAFGEGQAISPVRLEDLSVTEGKVLRLLSARMSYKEMAKELGVSVNTIKTHVQNVYSKLGVHSRAQVIKRVAELS